MAIVIGVKLSYQNDGVIQKVKSIFFALKAVLVNTARHIEIIEDGRARQ